MIQFDEHIFQTGWNHQPDEYSVSRKFDLQKLIGQSRNTINSPGHLAT